MSEGYFKVLLFGGTTEGRLLTKELLSRKVPLTVSVTTDYGGALLPEGEGLTVLVGRRDQEEMSRLMKEGDFSLVVDATHPYAAEATRNIRAAAQKAGVPLFRLVREREEIRNGLVFDSPREAADFLREKSGNVLLTTGSKELPFFADVPGRFERFYIRLLPAEGILQTCAELGFDPQKVLMAKGPFSYEQNLSHLERAGAAYLVTKESGAAGGFPEKMQAALDKKVLPLVIRRPERETGFSLGEILSKIEEMRKR